jgi:hypothetical protein
MTHEDIKARLTNIRTRNEQIWNEQGPDDYTARVEIHSTDFEWLYTNLNDCLDQLEASLKREEIAREALETVRNNGAKTTDDKWNIIRDTLQAMDEAK